LALGLMKKLLAQTDVGSIPTGYDISTWEVSLHFCYLHFSLVLSEQ
jgi:hypothetical protein